MSNKLVIKCGNFAVLLDLHVLPQGTSKDTSWFSVQEKEEICVLLKDTIESRVRQHIETHKQQAPLKSKEYTQSNPLFLKGNRLRIAAYFIKRWVRLRCVVKQQYRELHVFPDRFVVCASQLQTESSVQISNSTEAESLSKNCSSGTSHYFTERRGNETSSVSSITPKKQVALKNIIKKTDSIKDNHYEGEASTDGQIFPCLRITDKGNEDKKDQTMTKAQSEAACRSVEEPTHCIITTEKILTLPLPEVENHVNHRLPCETSSQQKQNLVTSVMQQKKRRHSSEGTPNTRKKADLRNDTFVSQNVNNDFSEIHKSLEDISFTSKTVCFSKISANTLTIGNTAVTRKLSEQTLTGKLPEWAETGTLPGQTVTGKLPEWAETEKLPGQTVTGKLPGQTVTGKPPEQTVTGKLPEQTVTVSEEILTAKLQAQTVASKLLEEKVTRTLLELIATGELLDPTVTSKPSEQIATSKPPEQTVTGKLPGQTPAGKQWEQTVSVKPPEQTVTGRCCSMESNQHPTRSLSSDIPTRPNSRKDIKKCTEFPSKKHKLQRPKKGQ
ncbi:protein SLX4IP [Pelobates fuscus]|uniref:protein SLX4IP n=1 Tax=Pelobates fuscus TaxID=191477 RepID=UPI002FE4E8A8